MLKHHNPPSVRAVPEAFRGIYSHAVELPLPLRLLALSGQIGIDPAGQIEQGFAAQCRQAMANVEALLEEARMGLEDIMRVTYYVTDAASLPELTALRKERWSRAKPPAVTTLVVAGLASAELEVEIEVLAGRS